MRRGRYRDGVITVNRIARHACAVLAAASLCAAPALAVDRSLGADVPKPQPAGAAWTDAQVAALHTDVDAMLREAAFLRGAHVGIYAIDARDGHVLYARNADDAFQPASTFKTLVGSAALRKLGPQWRMHTALTTTAPVENGRLEGALVLRGGGDPLLRASDLDAAAAAVAAAGIRSIDGPLLIDDSRFDQQRYGDGWSVDDLPYYYAPVVSGMMLEDDVVHLHVAPGPAVGARAQLAWEPSAGADERPPAGCPAAANGAHLVDEVVTGAADAKDTVDLRRAPCGVIRLSGTIPLGAKPDAIDAAVPSPERYVEDVLGAALGAHGVTLSAAAASAFPSLYGAATTTVPWPGANERVLWSHDSEPLSDILADMWFPSDNLIAETLLKQIAADDAGAPGTDAHGIAWELGWLGSLGIDTGAISIDDGSGLSAYDRITPRDLVTILTADWNGPNRDVVLDDLPLAGVRGTLRRSFIGMPAEKHVFGKTGSISHVATLVGYAATHTHGTVIFAFQVDDFVGSRTALNDLRGRVISRFVVQ
jgi:D-alanyl-D-alanine carboxypeptidase/D-alanyl-D-alanine-endopeptidase (penicillin-binding protein 4)